MLVCVKHIRGNPSVKCREKAHNLLNDLAGGVQVDETLMDLEFITIPGLGTFTTGLASKKSES